MLAEVISQNCRHISQLFQFLSVFGIDRFTVLEIQGSVIHARIGWPFDGSPNYDAHEEMQDVSWCMDHDPVLDDALFLLQRLSMSQHISIDKIVMPEPAVRELASEMGLSNESLDKLLSINVDMLDDGEKTDSFFVHF